MTASGSLTLKPSVSSAYLGLGRAAGIGLQESGPSRRPNGWLAGRPGPPRRWSQVSARARMSLGESLSPHPAHCGSRHPRPAPLPCPTTPSSSEMQAQQSIQPTLSKAFRALLGADLRVHHADGHVAEPALPAGSGGGRAQRRARLALTGWAPEEAA